MKLSRRQFVKTGALFLPMVATGQDIVPNRRMAFTKASTNGLLNSLISYWKFDVNVSPYADSVGGNPLTGTSTSAGVVAGIINGGLDVSLGGSFASHVDNSDFSPAANTSISFSLWISASNWAASPGNGFLLLKGDDATLNSYEIFSSGVGGPIRGLVQDTNSTLAQGNFVATPTNNVFHHFVIVFDSAGLQGRGYYDGALAWSGPLTSGSMKIGAQVFTLGVRAGNPSIANLTMDEMAMWHKALTQTDVTNLFNGGAALPLSGFAL